MLDNSISTKEEAVTKPKKAKSASQKKKKVYKPKLKPRIIYDNAQREFKSVIREGKSYYLVTHKNVEVYVGLDLNEALEKYNTVGIKEIVMPPVVEKKVVKRKA